MNKDHSAAIIISILLAIIIRGALEAIFRPVISLGWLSISFLQGLQAIVFFILTLRFVLGAIRYGSTEPKNLDFKTKSVNFVFAFLLFCSFYALAISVMNPGSFYVFIISLHAIDALWFGVALYLSRKTDDSNIPYGEINISSIRRVMSFFLILSVITVAYAIVSYKLFFKQNITTDGEIIAHFAFILFLFIVSIFDFYALRKYYFSHQDWVRDNCRIEPTTSPTT